MSNHRLTEIIQSIADEADQHQVDIHEILDSFSKQGFGILLILPCILLLIPPIGAIPGVPFLMGLLIALLSIQLIVGVKQPWLPRKIMDVKVKTKLVKKSINGLLPFTRAVDKYTKRRLQILFTFPMINIAACCCLCLSVLIMFIGWIPFLPFGVAAVVLIFAVGLTVGDGLFLAIGFGFTGVVGLVVSYFLS